jgi:hypothetical protein
MSMPAGVFARLEPILGDDDAIIVDMYCCLGTASHSLSPYLLPDYWLPVMS